MATQGNKGNAQGGNSQSSMESIRRITVGGIEFESGSGSNGDYVKMNGNDVSPDEIGQLASFFGREVRAASRGNEQKATDGRGEVLHPETDARLKGNEALRKNDPDRAGSNGQKGNRGNR